MAFECAAHVYRPNALPSLSGAQSLRPCFACVRLIIFSAAEVVCLLNFEFVMHHLLLKSLQLYHGAKKLFYIAERTQRSLVF